MVVNTHLLKRLSGRFKYAGAINWMLPSCRETGGMRYNNKYA